ncbi:beta family protein [Clavibacter michiganensis]|uniref:beta family protein n=1 Tax=Clavibacter michiganensis TaxID=28447 RepID=UPI00345C0D5A
MAELGALETCTSSELVPLLEVLNPRAAVDSISRAWSRDADITWIHSLNFDDVAESEFADGIVSMFEELRENVRAVPVITVTEGAETLAAVARIVESDRRGVVFRLEAEDLLEEGADISSQLVATMQVLHVSYGEVDIVLDAGLVDGAPPVLAAVADQCLRAMPELTHWRNVVVAFSAFPNPVSTVVPVSSVGSVPRNEAPAFMATKRGISRELIYADYAIGTPTYASVPFAPIPNIRYASGASWQVHRAAQKKDPSPQYRQLAQDVVAAPYYSGPEFSPGDQQIENVSSGVSGPGNAMTHLRAGISRHLHVVLDRLATLGEP